MFGVGRWFSGILGVMWILLLGNCGSNPDQVPMKTLSLQEELAGGVVIMDAFDPGHPTCGALMLDGWHTPEKEKFAWTSQVEAGFLLPVRNTAATRLALRGYGLAGSGEKLSLEILVNGYSLGPQLLPRQGANTFWDIPPHRLRVGLNEVTLKLDQIHSPRELGLSGDDRPLGVLVEWVGLLGPDQEPDPKIYEMDDPGTYSPLKWRTTRLSHPSGGILDLAWEGEALPSVEIAEQPGALPLFTGVVEPDSAGRAAITFPADLPPGSWLMIGGVEGKLIEAGLAFPQPETDVLLIIVDTLRPDYLGCYGGDGSHSPNIDALASGSILFENAVSQVPITGPSHASMFTSRFPSDTGVINNGIAGIPAQLPTLAQILTERGWDSRAAVSISTIDGRWQFGRGFATYDDRLGDTWILRADTMITRVEALLDRPERPRFVLAHFADPHEPYDAHGLVHREAVVTRDGKVLASIPTSTYTPTRIDLDLPAGTTTLTISSDDPFRVRNLGLRDSDGVQLSFPDLEVAHEPLTVTLNAEKAGTAGLLVHLCDLTDEAAPIDQRYAREVAFVDQQIGRIIDRLKTEGRYDDTLIIFLADHGEALGEHGCVGHVKTLYDVMVRVPLIIKPAGYRGKAQRRTDQAALVDLLPTVLGQMKMPALPTARGRDLLAKGAAKEPTLVFMETHRPESDKNLFGLRTSEGKVIFNPDDDSWEYFDLRKDPGEQDNLAADGQPEFEEHRKLLLGLLSRLQLVGRTAEGEVEIDPHTAEMLRSLGY